MPASHLLRSNPLGSLSLVLSMKHERDRFVSTIQLVRDQCALLQLTSAEGDATDDWPPSPPVQQLHQQPGPCGEFVAGIGMSGSSHWSVSVTASNAQAQLEFDVACRAKADVGSAASTYRLTSSEGLILPSDMGLTIDAGPCAISLVGDDAEQTSCRIKTQGDRLIVVRPSHVDASFPQTVRWKYRIEVVGPVDKVGSV